MGRYEPAWPDKTNRGQWSLATSAANRAWDYLRSIQAKDGHLPQNTQTTGEPFWQAVQLDQTALPIVLAWQLGRTDSGSLDAVRRAAELLTTYSKDGYPRRSADILEKAGDAGPAQKYRATADDWASKVEGWTATRNGPHSPQPYYLRLTKDGKPNGWRSPRTRP